MPLFERGYRASAQTELERKLRDKGRFHSFREQL